MGGNMLPPEPKTRHNGGVDTREILERIIYPEDPDLARRINALFWSYERSRLRHSLNREPLIRRAPRRDDDASQSLEDRRKR
jgi:hypothetical protein